MPGREPIDKRSTDVQINRQGRKLGQRLQQRQIGVAIDIFVDRFQIADRLMLVQHQHEAQGVRHDRIPFRFLLNAMLAILRRVICPTGPGGAHSEPRRSYPSEHGISKSSR